MTARRHPWRPFPRLLTMGLTEVGAFVAGPRDVCISINSPRSGEEAKLSANFRAVLRLRFDDLGGFDEPYPAGAVQLSSDDADRIVAFAEEHRGAARMVVHCAAGASRSVAVALALGVCFTHRWCWPTWYRSEWRATNYVHNEGVFLAVFDAFKRRFPDAPAIITQSFTQRSRNGTRNEEGTPPEVPSVTRDSGSSDRV